MPKVNPNFAAKWARVTPERVQDYVSGVQNPRADWEQSTVAAKDNWKKGVEEAAKNDQFAKGVQLAGTAKWQKKAIELGPARFETGVKAAEQDYAQGFAPYVTVIENTTLPPRFPKGDPRNIERVKVLNAALRAKKMSL